MSSRHRKTYFVMANENIPSIKQQYQKNKQPRDGKIAALPR
jgi:hypothetical protein